MGSDHYRSESTRDHRWPAALVLVMSVIAYIGLTAIPSNAAGSVVVSLTFDNGSISQYTLGYQQALQPHGARATFFVNSGTITVNQGANFMTWSKLSDLAAAGDDIGGKTVNATNLTTDPDPTTQVCQDRQNLISHGLTPIAFAYPGGTNNATVQSIVKNCGYGNGRTAGGLSVGTPTTGTSAETLPPLNWFATRAYAPAAVTLANMQSIVTNAASKGGGWTQIVIGRVCSQSLDSANYTSCNGASGHIELADLNTFLDWMANAGQTGGAPVGSTIDTVAHVVTSADNVAPSTTITCNDAPCSNNPYTGSVTVKLSATDVGSGVSSTHYTTDGTDPTLQSPTYTSPFGVNGAGASTTVKFRSWDRANNAEAVQTQVVQAPADTTAPTTTISCNGSACNGPYVDTVSVSLAATDAGGSGVDKTYYTTDGSTPTTSSTVYTAAFQLTQSATVKFFSTDKAANAEQVQSQQIQVGTHATIVSLTFDNGTIGQYTLAYQRALQPHNAHATFFVNSGNIGTSAQLMTWNQLSNLAADGNDIGGKTVSATNLKTDPDPVTQVCQDRQNLISRGFNPIAFAYPGGAFDATVKNIVQSCGYGNARSAGSLTPNGPTYAETIPPKDWLATRAYPGTGTPSAVTLADMKNLVTGAAVKGGWVQIVITRVCSQSLDPANYSACTAASSHVELADLVAFLDWVQNAGQNGGAPAGTLIQTVRDTVTAADNVTPTTGSSCDVGPCSGSYNSVVKVTLSPTDLGTGISSTHYTTDGSTPTLQSPTYTRRIAITSPTTLKFRSWDNAGNVEATQTLSIQATPPSDSAPPTTTISCNDAACTNGVYVGLVTVKLTADDGSGWGVDGTFYTTDGSTPNTSSTAYTGPFQLSTGDYTVKFFSIDFAGNAESVNSRTIHVSPAKTVVSITFDDGDLSQYSLAFQRGLQPHNMRGTFFINTGNVGGGPGFVTWSNLSTLAGNGQDVAGHTIHHIDLTSSSYTQQQKIDEVCNDRQALIDHGLSPVSFAYPFGAYDTNAESIVQNCGYTSGRRTGGLPANPPPYAETIPPPDPFATLTWTAPTPTDSPIQLSDMQAAVTGAATHGGGWVQLVIHEVCSQTYDPADYASCLGSFRPMELDTFNAFLDWLQNAGQGGAPAGTVVQPISQVMNGPDTQAPTTTIACNGAPCLNAGWYKTTPVSISLTAADYPGGSGVDKIYYTTDGSTPTTSSTVYTGAFAVSATTTVRFFSTDLAANAEAPQSQQIQIDTVAPATSIACNGSTCQGTYAGTVSVSLDAIDTGGSGVDKTYYTTDGSTPTNSSTVYTNAFQLSQTTTVKFFSTDQAGNAETAKLQLITVQASDTTPPTTTIACDGTACATGWYAASPVSVTLSANDTGGSGVDKTYYTTNGSTPTTSSTVYTGAFQISATTTVKFFSTDLAGNAESPQSQQIQIDTVAPATSIACNGSTCQGTYAGTVSVTLSPVDTGGSGVDKTYYTTNGSTPTTSSSIYTGSFDVAQTTTVKFFSTDLASNAETVQSQQIQIGTADTTSPTTIIACNDAACTTGWYKTSAVSVTLSATDDAGGSGVDKTYYTTNGSTPTTSSTVYTVPFQVSATTTVKFFSTDLAGNAESPQSQQIQIDTVAPATSIACNGSTCQGTYAGTVSVTLSPVDTGGSGVDKTYYTTNGSTPTTSSSVYTGVFQVSATTTVKFFSTDNAGNAEQPNSQQIDVQAPDGTPPTTTIACGGAACATGWYTTSVSVTLAATDSGGSGVDKTYYTTNGSTPTTSSTVYTGVFQISTTTIVKFFSTDLAGNAESPQSQQIQIDAVAPATSIACDGSTCQGTYTGTVSVMLSPVDTGGSGMDRTYYTTDGSTPTTSSPLYTGAFRLYKTATVKFFSTDTAGNAETVKSQQIDVLADTTPPTTTIACNGAPCGTGAFTKTPVKINLSATDTGGSGLDITYYTTNGSTPTTSSTAYIGQFSVTKTTTIKFFSTDKAGNAESVKSQQITIDTTAPTTSISCNGTTCSTGWYKTTPVSVALSASDSGSGVNLTYYTTDGTTPTTSSLVYAGSFTVGQTTTVKFFSVDNAGNKESVKSETIRIDTVAPSVGVTSPTSGQSFKTGTKVSLAATATDAGTGTGAASGIAKLVFYLDSTTVLATDTGTPYTATWNTVKVTVGTHTITAVATDAAGNSTTSAAITITMTN